MKERITSVENKKIKEWSKLLQKKYRDKTDQFIVEGHHLVQEAQASNLVLQIISTDEKTKGIWVSDNVIKKLVTTMTPQSIVAICQKPNVMPLGNKVVCLRNVQDPGNVGTIIRSALAFGFSDVIVQGTDIFNGKVLRSTQGAMFKINVLQSKDLLREIKDYQKIITILDKDAQSYKALKLKSKIAILFGNEGQGLDKEAISVADDKIYIPIKFESLNVASAAAIILNEYK